MSFSSELAFQADQVYAHLKTTGDYSHSLNNYFKNCKKQYDTFLAAVTKMTRQLYCEFPDNNQSSQAIKNILKIIISCVQTGTQKSALFQQQIIDPLDFFLDNFNKTNQQLIMQLKKPKSKLEDSKAEVEKMKQKYYKAQNKADKQKIEVEKAFTSQTKQNKMQKVINTQTNNYEKASK